MFSQSFVSGISFTDGTANRGLKPRCTWAGSSLPLAQCCWGWKSPSSHWQSTSRNSSTTSVSLSISKICKEHPWLKFSIGHPERQYWSPVTCTAWLQGYRVYRMCYFMCVLQRKLWFRGLFLFEMFTLQNQSIVNKRWHLKMMVLKSARSNSFKCVVEILNPTTGFLPGTILADPKGRASDQEYHQSIVLYFLKFFLLRATFSLQRELHG